MLAVFVQQKTSSPRMIAPAMMTGASLGANTISTKKSALPMKKGMSCLPRSLRRKGRSNTWRRRHASS